MFLQKLVRNSQIIIFQNFLKEITGEMNRWEKKCQRMAKEMPLRPSVHWLKIQKDHL